MHIVLVTTVLALSAMLILGAAVQRRATNALHRSTEALRGVTEAHKALATAHAKLWERYQETLNLVAVAAHVNGEASPMLAMECGKLLRRHNVNATVTSAPLGAGSGRLN